MAGKFDIKQAADLTSLAAWMKSDAIFTKTESPTKKTKPGDLIELTRLTLPAGSWLIAGQGSFQVVGGLETYIEYRLRMRYSTNNSEILSQLAYLHIPGGAFGTQTVIDAAVFDRMTTVELLYLEEPFNSTPNKTSPPSTAVQGQILIALKTSSPFVFE